MFLIEYLNLNKSTKTGDRSLRLEHKDLTLSNTKWGTDLGTLVVPFDQTFHLLH